MLVRIRFRSIVALVLLSGCTAMAGAVPELAAADRTQARVITRAGPEATPGVRYVPVHPDRPEAAQLVRRAVVEPAAVVSRALSEQPVYTHLVEVEVGGLTVLIDPEVDYRRPTGGLDENHTIRRAQRLHRVIEARPARVLRHPDAAYAPQVTGSPAPDAIFLRPERLPTPPKRHDLLVQGE